MQFKRVRRVLPHEFSLTHLPGFLTDCLASPRLGLTQLPAFAALRGLVNAISAIGLGLVIKTTSPTSLVLSDL